MPNITAELPLLIEYQDAQYHLRAALFDGVRAGHKRYAKALEQYRKVLQKRFKNFEVERDNLAAVLWYCFDPKPVLNLIEYNVRYGKQRIRGKFAQIHYYVKSQKYICFPKLDYLTLMACESNEAMEIILFDSVQHFFRDLNKELGSEFDERDYVSPESASLSLFQGNFHCQTATFPFSHEDFDFFEYIQEYQTFDGGRELQKVGHDLNECYPDELMTAIFRDDIVQELHDYMYLSSPSAIVVLGARGCGKTSIIHTSLQQFLMQQNIINERLKKCWFLDPLRVISGMSIVGMWQRRMEAIIEHIRQRLKNISKKTSKESDLLYIRNVVALFRIGKSAQNNLTLSDLLKPYIEKRSFTVILEATPEEWQIAEALDRKFTDLFSVIRVGEQGDDIVLHIINTVRADLETLHQCQFTSRALLVLWELRHQFADIYALPGSLTRIMKQIASRSVDQEITEETIYNEFQNATHYREIIYQRDLPLSRAQIIDAFDQTLVGQNAAKHALANVVQIVKARLTDPQKPLASLLFIGPTGVGKTEAAKVLTHYLYNSDKQLVRFDMNEYVDDNACGRLIGDSVRTDGQLTNQVRFLKSCIVLFDEIEKAHATVHDLLLQVLGEGRLTDVLGRTTNFCQTIIIMTSNLGASEAMTRLGFATHASDSSLTYVQAVSQYFRPEFINRIDEQVIFQPLALNDAMTLTRLQINKLMHRDGFRRRMVFLNVNAKTLESIAHRGFDKHFGGRSLKRSIEKTLTTLSARELVQMPPDKPVLLEIYVTHSALALHMQHLDYETYQQIDIVEIEAEKAASIVLQVWRDIEQLEARINEKIDHAERALVLELWGLKERLLDFKQSISGLCWDIENWQKNNPRKVFVVQNKSAISKSWRWHRSAFRHKYSDHDIGDYFEQLYRTAVELLEVTHQYALQTLQEYRYIVLTENFIRSKISSIGISITPLIENYQQQTVFFITLYQSILRGLQAQEVRTTRKQGVQQFIFAEGHGLEALLKAENGVHLYQIEKKIMPFKIVIRGLNGQSEADFMASEKQDKVKPPERKHPGDIIRLYNQSATSEILMNDFRSGLMSRGEVNQYDWKLLLLNRMNECLF